ncbi:unnamed protein product [Amaranthus hypochondriacus]
MEAKLSEKQGEDVNSIHLRAHVFLCHPFPEFILKGFTFSKN